ncbi:MAG: hypothetical protein P8L85_19455 [Rubripirellula sp.]|nr:hypothetical protein [Rubripirellula sp.]
MARETGFASPKQFDTVHPWWLGQPKPANRHPNPQLTDNAYQDLSEVSPADNHASVQPVAKRNTAVELVHPRRIHRQPIIHPTEGLTNTTATQQSHALITRLFMLTLNCLVHKTGP